MKEILKADKPSDLKADKPSDKYPWMAATTSVSGEQVQEAP